MPHANRVPAIHTLGGGSVQVHCHNRLQRLILRVSRWALQPAQPKPLQPDLLGFPHSWREVLDDGHVDRELGHPSTGDRHGFSAERTLEALAFFQEGTQSGQALQAEGVRARQDPWGVEDVVIREVANRTFGVGECSCCCLAWLVGGERRRRGTVHVLQYFPQSSRIIQARTEPERRAEGLTLLRSAASPRPTRSAHVFGSMASPDVCR